MRVRARVRAWRRVRARVSETSGVQEGVAVVADADNNGDGYFKADLHI